TSGRGPVAAWAPAPAREVRLAAHGAETAHRAALLSEAVRSFERHHGRRRLQLDFEHEVPFAHDEPLWRLIRLVEPLGERVIVSTGADWQLRKLRRLAPRLLLGFDVMHYIDWQPANEPRDPRALPKRLGAYGYYDDHPIATKRIWSVPEYLLDRCESLLGLVPDVSAFYIEHGLLAQSLADGFNWTEPLHARGVLLDAWTMDVGNAAALANAERLLAASVDMFTTNTPRALERVLRSKSGW